MPLRTATTKVVEGVEVAGGGTALVVHTERFSGGAELAVGIRANATHDFRVNVEAMSLDGAYLGTLSGVRSTDRAKTVRLAPHTSRCDILIVNYDQDNAATPNPIAHTYDVYVTEWD